MIEKLLEEQGLLHPTDAVPTLAQVFRGIVRCILAAATLEGAKEDAKAVTTAVASHREDSSSSTLALERIWMRLIPPLIKTPL